MKIALMTLGCKLNYAETSTWERGFKAAGWEVVPWSASADVYLINTCSVTETAEKKSRNYIRRAHKTAPSARIVVTGCYAELRREQLLEIDGVWLVLGASEKKNLVESVREGVEVLEGTLSGNNATLGLEGGAHLWEGPAQPEFQDSVPSGTVASLKTGKFEDTDHKNRLASLKTGIFEDGTAFGAYSSGERTRSFLKVQDGCDNFCAYCTVPYARGRSRNVPVCEVVRMAQEIAAQGVKEVVLTGVNTGDFGRTTGESFLELLKALNEVEGIERFRISSIEPNLITPEIIDWIASGTKFQKHFHIPLQSGSDTILRKMGRRYNTELFASRIDYIRKALERPGESKVFFGIDVIAGLPGETEELFQETYDFLCKVRPAFIHVFPYSRRPGTPAAAMKEQVQDSVKTERVARLEALCKELNEEFYSLNKGLPEKVLWESSVKNGMMGGYTGNYLRLERKYDEKLVNTIQDINI